MEQKSMTALISAFSRAYHSLNNDVTIFNDNIVRQLLTEEEYLQISKSMTDGIAFFNPTFKGEQEQALRWVVDNQLSPSPLGRAAFAEASLKQAAKDGATQYLIFGAGYDTFAYRQPSWAKSLSILEIDHPATSKDKQERLKAANIAIPDNVHYIQADFTKEDWQKALQNHSAYDCNKTSCCTILGVAYYLPKQAFATLISIISDMVKKGSTIIFDYPDQYSYTPNAGERAKKQSMLANAAKEKMLASYSYINLKQLLLDRNFLITNHLTPQTMTEQYFKAYNNANPTHPMTAFDNTNYCLATKI